VYDAEGKDDCRHLVNPETSPAKKSDSEGVNWRGEAKNRTKQLKKRKVNEER